tara:strand:+ start:805 stop:2502 length:1698 start_codon:yes stop_codon:yes gene_type:complete
MIYKIKNFKKINIKNTGYAISLMFLLYASFVLFYLSYDIVLSPDFEKYITYFQFYDGQLKNTSLEQGNFYFYFIYLVTLITKNLISGLTVNEILNLSIHFSNLLFIISGFIGLYKYLKIKGFQKNNIYLSLICIVFLPSVTEFRLSFKPEILAFAFLGWMFYFLQRFKNTKNKFYAYQLIFLGSIIATSKVSIALMVGIVLLLEVFISHRYLLSKKFIKFYILFFLCFAILTVDNYLINEKLVTQVEHDEKYNNKASIDFFTTFNNDQLIPNPNRYFFSDSFFGILLLDTFGDFFKLYWNSEYTELNIDRYNFFEIYDTNNFNTIPKLNFDKEEFILKISANFDERFSDTEYVNETRMRTGYKITIIFYFLIILSFLFNKKNRILLISPFIGILLVAFSASGVFVNNFDPEVGDAVKTFYYSFFIAISCCILFCKILEKFKIGKKTFVLFIVLVNLFIIGFPHKYTVSTIDDLYYKNATLPTCEINNEFIWELFNVPKQDNCNHLEFTYRDVDNKFKFEPISSAPSLKFETFFQNIPIINLMFIIILILNSYNIFKTNRKDYERR